MLIQHLKHTNFLDIKCNGHERLDVLSRREVESRVEIKFDAYSNTKLVEYKLGIDIARRKVMPAILDHLNGWAEHLSMPKWSIKCG